jgi:hypothetical protein
MPVYPVLPSRAMSFYPAYFEHAVPNSSRAFDYEEWCVSGRQAAATQGMTDTRNHPLPLIQIDTSSELRIAGNTGELILFSASHLHATAANDSGLTRFSLDFRTVAASDLAEARHAPNVDSEAAGSTLGDFIRASDLTSGLLDRSLS